MGIRAKTKKRLLIMLTVVLLVGAAGGGAYWLRQRQFKERALASREAGLAALQRGELEAAIRHLARYLKRFPGDAECLFRLAEGSGDPALARRRTEDANKLLAMARKIDAIDQTGVQTVVTCDTGCLMNIYGGLQKQAQPQRVVHLAEVLAGAIEAE